MTKDEFDFRQGQDFFFLLCSIQWVQGTLSPGIKQETGTYHLTSSRATARCIFMVWCLIKHRYSFTFYLCFNEVCFRNFHSCLITHSDFIWFSKGSWHWFYSLYRCCLENYPCLGYIWNAQRYTLLRTFHCPVIETSSFWSPPPITSDDENVVYFKYTLDAGQCPE
jgi:hypothetical protein